VGKLGGFYDNLRNFGTVGMTGKILKNARDMRIILNKGFPQVVAVENHLQ
jgi:hypothetical protein